MEKGFGFWDWEGIRNESRLNRELGRELEFDLGKGTRWKKFPVPMNTCCFLLLFGEVSLLASIRCIHIIVLTIKPRWATMNPRQRTIVANYQWKIRFMDWILYCWFPLLFGVVSLVMGAIWLLVKIGCYNDNKWCWEPAMNTK
jgi:hypothetical protein